LVKSSSCRCSGLMKSVRSIRRLPRWVAMEEHSALGRRVRNRPRYEILPPCGGTYILDTRYGDSYL
jgi:hypothetical protein